MEMSHMFRKPILSVSFVALLVGSGGCALGQVTSTKSPTTQTTTSAQINNTPQSNQKNEQCAALRRENTLLTQTVRDLRRQNKKLQNTSTTLFTRLTQISKQINLIADVAQQQNKFKKLLNSAMLAINLAQGEIAFATPSKQSAGTEAIKFFSYVVKQGPDNLKGCQTDKKCDLSDLLMVLEAKYYQAQINYNGCQTNTALKLYQNIKQQAKSIQNLSNNSAVNSDLQPTQNQLSSVKTLLNKVNGKITTIQNSENNSQ